MSTTTTTRVPHPVRAAAMAVGVVFLLVGVLGFVPGITAHLDRISFAGPGSGAHLLGVFHVSVLHNLVHLLFGVAGLALARSVPAARGYLIGGGALYVVLWLYGLLVDEGSAADFVPLNAADDWLHLGLGAGMVALGLALQGNPNARSA
ncbi:DUF4383 domain-containing protein [Saccharothrix syringae]|uniref:DUF4383 domain-containing protein n=1 Tax=Saccharothrix syringae TaxID=103733 RepID=A0A5Q0GYR6_SACSY|nr:DUF4383 domain-containing protein [Saccharothrix syringae]QFZ19151.1 DUF4383 domain-containing protein [Saccharothrix syringae]